MQIIANSKVNTKTILNVEIAWIDTSTWRN